MTLSVSRRALMKGAGAGFAAALFQPAVRAADSQESQTLKTVESTLSQIRRRRARGTSGLWPSSP